MPPQHQQQMPPPQSMEEMSKIAPFSQDLSNTMSDNFSYLDEKEIKHSFFYLESNNDNLPDFYYEQQHTPQQIGNMNTKQSEKQQQFTQDLDKLRQARDSLQKPVQRF